MISLEKPPPWGLPLERHVADRRLVAGRDGPLPAREKSKLLFGAAEAAVQEMTVTPSPGQVEGVAGVTHMGGAWGTERELAITEAGHIHDKKADVRDGSVNVIGTTAILLDKVTLLAAGASVPHVRRAPGPYTISCATDRQWGRPVAGFRALADVPRRQPGPVLRARGRPGD